MKKIITLFILTTVVLVSCKKDLLKEITPLDRVPETAVWSDESLIKAYHNELYNAIPHGFGIHLYSKFADEAYNSVPSGQGPELFKLNSMDPDNIGRVNNADNNWMYFWNRGFSYIRKVSIFLEKMAAPGSVEIANKARYIAEAKFIRAFIYFNLVERYGGVPIVTQSYDLEDNGSVNFKRNTFDECVAFIQKDLTEAIADLPAKYPSTDANYGRATKDASYALLSRLLL